MKFDLSKLNKASLCDIVKQAYPESLVIVKSNQVYGMPLNKWYTVWSKAPDEGGVEIGASSPEAFNAWMYAAERILKASYGPAAS